MPNRRYRRRARAALTFPQRRAIRAIEIAVCKNMDIWTLQELRKFYGRNNRKALSLAGLLPEVREVMITICDHSYIVVEKWYKRENDLIEWLESSNKDVKILATRFGQGTWPL